jgi:hypothetical protein
LVGRRAPQTRHPPGLPPTTDPVHQVHQGGNGWCYPRRRAGSGTGPSTEWGVHPIMAKRNRGRGRPAGNRPRPRTAPTAARPAATRQLETVAAPQPGGGLTPEEEARAAELEARLAQPERSAPGRRREDRPPGRSRWSSGGSLAAAAEEYAYVARDLRRIVVLQAALLAILLFLWLVIHGLHLVQV